MSADLVVGRTEFSTQPDALAAGKRRRVAEHRITRSLGLYKEFSVRFWIETDPEFGGESRRDAEMKIHDSFISLEPNLTRMTPDQVAAAFLEAVPSANSVEVCDTNGNGTAVHRDWP